MKTILPGFMSPNVYALHLALQPHWNVSHFPGCPFPFVTTHLGMCSFCSWEYDFPCFATWQIPLTLRAQSWVEVLTGGRPGGFWFSLCPWCVAQTRPIINRCCLNKVRGYKEGYVDELEIRDFRRKELYFLCAILLPHSICKSFFFEWLCILKGY